MSIIYCWLSERFWLFYNEDYKVQIAYATLNFYKIQISFTLRKKEGKKSKYMKEKLKPHINKYSTYKLILYRENIIWEALWLYQPKNGSSLF
jgi:hypothetical protein